MKKFFSLIALVGVIAACTPEQVDTAFKLAGGKVIVEVEVVDIINGGQYGGPVNIKFFRGGLDVTQEFTPVVGAGAHSYMWQAEDSQAVPAGDYVVGVSGDNLAKEYPSNLLIPGVLAGGEAVVKAIVPVGEPINGGWTVDFNQGEWEDEGEETEYLVNSHYPTHIYSHDGIDEWYYNNSEFAIPGTVDYELALSYVCSDVVDNNILGFEGYVQQLADYLEDEDSLEDTYEFTASAWSMWNVTRTIMYASCPFTVFAFKDADEDGEWDASEEKLELGGLTLNEYYAGLVEYHELPYPGAEGHYTPGHGHDAHGSMPNAGGGIAFND